MTIPERGYYIEPRFEDRPLRLARTLDRGQRAELYDPTAGSWVAAPGKVHGAIMYGDWDFVLPERAEEIRLWMDSRHRQPEPRNVETKGRGRALAAVAGALLLVAGAFMVVPIWFVVQYGPSRTGSGEILSRIGIVVLSLFFSALGGIAFWIASLARSLGARGGAGVLLCLVGAFAPCATAVITGIGSGFAPERMLWWVILVGVASVAAGIVGLRMADRA